MNLSYEWLRELVNLSLPPAELAKRLTFAGIAIEGLEEQGADHVLVAEVTTNRPDWLGHYGVAREIAALTGRTAKTPAWELRETGPAVPTLTQVEVAEPELCPRYTARLIRGVKVKPSPDWLQRRLTAVGLRPINNVVDITNYVLLELNQPLHAFDFDRLQGGRIVVRRARTGETIPALDGQLYRLTPENLVIADAERPVAVAGVMGGSPTEVSERTVNVLLESAYFQPATVRRTSRQLKLASDSSYRFERGIDLGGVERASARAAALILELAGGELCAGVIDTAPAAGATPTLRMRFSRCAKVLGCEFEHVEIDRIFRGLGLEVMHKDASHIDVRVPSFRADLTREIDLIEEVARVAGYDRIPTRVGLPLCMSEETPLVSGAAQARQVLTGLGYYECRTDSFVKAAWEETFQPWHQGEALRVENPINLERPLLRRSLLPSLLEVRRVNRASEEVRLFELNRTYHRGEKAVEPLRLALLDDRGLEYVHGALDEIMAALRAGGQLRVESAADLPGFQPDSVGRIFVDDATVGVLGLPAAEILRHHDLDRAPALLEIDFAVIANRERRMRIYRPLPRFPAIRRDLALVVQEDVLWRRIEDLVRQAASRLESLDLESVFRGQGIPAGHKSVAFSMVFRAEDRSLQDEEANALRDAVLNHLTASIPGAKLR